MSRFDGIKKVKVSLRRNTYRGKRIFAAKGAVIRWILAIVLVLAVMAFDCAGYNASERFRQDYLSYEAD